MTEEEKRALEDLKRREERKALLKRIAFALLEQCKGENLTIKETVAVLEIVRHYLEETTLHDGLAL